MAQNIELVALQTTLKQTGAPWQASATPHAALPPDQKKRRLGANPPQGPQMLLEREQTASVKRSTENILLEAATYPDSYDLRNVKGSNYITSIKDQGNCGCCVAFGSTAAVEGTLRFQKSDANLAVDLSEAQLFFCIASTENCNCETGWWPPKALDGYKNTGIVDDSCFSYTDHDQGCNLCSNWQSRVTKITGWHEITATAEMKTWLSTKGPLVTCLSVYDDFFAYTSGIYTHVSGTLQGGHCICIVGYDDNQGCWIGKNSWGTAWGENGFFRIAYGQCGIDATMWAVEGITLATQDTNWVNNILITALYATDQDRNAWAYLDGIGWRQIAYDDNNIFYNLLSQLLAAKAAKRQCNVYLDHDVITQVYVL